MVEFNVYIANLGKYNEGELQGAWFTPPLNFDEVKEKIGLNDEYEEFAIHDYESPIPVHEYTSLEEINNMANLFQEIPDNLANAIDDMMNEWFSSLEELVESIDLILVYPDCHNMYEVAKHLIEEEEYMGHIPSPLLHHIDFHSYARELESQFSFIESKAGVLWLAD